MRVAIVGAGPAGIFSSILLKIGGVKEVFLFDRERFPRVKPCGGGLSPFSLKILKRYGLLKELYQLGNEVNSLDLYIDKKRIELRGGGSALIINRKEFDNFLLERAIRLGVKFFPETFIDRLIEEKGKVWGVRSKDREWEADIVIVAGGAKTNLSIGPRKKQYLEAIVSWYRGLNLARNTISMFYFNSILPHYCWIFPERGGIYNIGVCRFPKRGSPSLISIYNRFLEEIKDSYLKGAERISKVYTHPIVYTDIPRGLVNRNVLWIGEASRLTDVATGEGIYYALKSAELSSYYILKAKSYFELELLRLYEREMQLLYLSRSIISRAFVKFVSKGGLHLFSYLYDRFNYLSFIGAKLLSFV